MKHIESYFQRFSSQQTANNKVHDLHYSRVLNVRGIRGDIARPSFELVKLHFELCLIKLWYIFMKGIPLRKIAFQVKTVAF